MKLCASLKRNGLRGLVVIYLSCLSMIVAAQDEVDLDVDIGSDDTGGLPGPMWAWVIGLAVFIIVILAIVKRRK